MMMKTETAQLFAAKTILDCRGAALTLQYCLLTGEDEAGTARYGAEIRASGRDGQSCARLPDITASREKIQALLRLLEGGCVTPETLSDVVQDWL